MTGTTRTPLSASLTTVTGTILIPSPPCGATLVSAVGVAMVTGTIRMVVGREDVLDAAWSEGEAVDDVPRVRVWRPDGDVDAGVATVSVVVVEAVDVEVGFELGVGLELELDVPGVAVAGVNG